MVGNNNNLVKKKLPSQQPSLRQPSSQQPSSQQQIGNEAFTKRDYSPSNYIQDKYTQYRIGMDNYYPLQITEIPFYNDVYYSMPNSLGAPIYVNPSYNTLENASFLSNPVYQIQDPFNQNDINQVMMQPNRTMYGGQDMSMERDSYFNTMNAQNKDINYKDFIPKKVEKKERKPVIKYVSNYKDHINSIVIIMLTSIILLHIK